MSNIEMMKSFQSLQEISEIFSYFVESNDIIMTFEPCERSFWTLINVSKLTIKLENICSKSINKFNINSTTIIRRFLNQDIFKRESADDYNNMQSSTTKFHKYCNQNSSKKSINSLKPNELTNKLIKVNVEYKKGKHMLIDQLNNTMNASILNQLLSLENELYNYVDNFINGRVLNMEKKDETNINSKQSIQDLSEGRYRSSNELYIDKSSMQTFHRRFSHVISHKISPILKKINIHNTVYNHSLLRSKTSTNSCMTECKCHKIKIQSSGSVCFFNNRIYCINLMEVEDTKHLNYLNLQMVDAVMVIFDFLNEDSINYANFCNYNITNNNTLYNYNYNDIYPGDNLKINAAKSKRKFGHIFNQFRYDTQIYVSKSTPKSVLKRKILRKLKISKKNNKLISLDLEINIKLSTDVSDTESAIDSPDFGVNRNSTVFKRKSFQNIIIICNKCDKFCQNNFLVQRDIYHYLQNMTKSTIKKNAKQTKNCQYKIIHKFLYMRALEQKSNSIYENCIKSMSDFFKNDYCDFLFLNSYFQHFCSLIKQIFHEYRYNQNAINSSIQFVRFIMHFHVIKLNMVENYYKINLNNVPHDQNGCENIRNKKFSQNDVCESNKLSISNTIRNVSNNLTHPHRKNNNNINLKDVIFCSAIENWNIFNIFKKCVTNIVNQKNQRNFK
ncbi:hypothetical protein A3Q56_05626 [Intoshia linei]|uniref:Uncharacterized protein n=1 Tax=Intoshia linei TaxID=1819745 RepID=A0A177AXD0_9BILA|nr:hypothetical protein A3Q56_05626 [Intoshia linei]